MNLTRSFAFVAAATLLAGFPQARAQVENQSGWSQPSVTGGEYGQRRDGVQWQTQSDGAGTTFYSDTNGKHCWSQPSATGGQFTSCR